MDTLILILEQMQKRQKAGADGRTRFTQGSATLSGFRRDGFPPWI